MEDYLSDTGLSRENPVFTYKQDDFIDDCFYKMADAYYLKHGGEVKRLAYLYLFLSKLTEFNPGSLSEETALKTEDCRGHPISGWRNLHNPQGTLCSLFLCHSFHISLRHKSRSL